MNGLGERFATKPTIGNLYTVVLPAAPQVSWPLGCAQCGRPGPQRKQLLRVHPLAGAAGMPVGGPIHLEVPMCTVCRWRVEQNIGGLLVIGSALAALMTGMGKARHGIGPFFDWRWLRMLPLLLWPIGVCLLFRSRHAVDIAGDGQQLRVSFPSLAFADSFAALHGRRIEPPIGTPPEPATEHQPILEEHDKAD
jgi:hypothetical protein